MAVSEWAAKRDLMKEEFSESTYKGIFFHGLVDKNDADRYKAFVDATKNWDESMPSPVYHPEIANLCERLFKISNRDAVNFFINSSLAEFKARIEQARGRSPLTQVNEWFSDTHHTLIALDQERLHSVRASVESRRLDQRLYYMNVDSAQVWNELINVGDYRVYDWCRESLRAIVRSDEWKTVIRDARIETIVMLGGGGSASKDVEILSSLVEENYRQGAEKTRFLLVDISPHMLSSSISRIKKYFRRENRAHKLIEIEAYVADMLYLGALKPRLRRLKSKNAWFLTGGTIGNFNEARLLSSLGDVAQVGDLLVIGIDTYEPDDLEQDMLSIREKYRPEAMQDFLATPVSILLHHLNPDMTVSKLREAIAVDVVDGRSRGYSDIDNTLTVEVRLILSENDSYTLLTSTRYEKSDFIAWFAARGWRHLTDTTPTDRTASFRQVLFEKVSKK